MLKAQEKECVNETHIYIKNNGVAVSNMNEGAAGREPIKPAIVVSMQEHHQAAVFGFVSINLLETGQDENNHLSHRDLSIPTH